MRASRRWLVRSQRWHPRRHGRYRGISTTACNDHRSIWPHIDDDVREVNDDIRDVSLDIEAYRRMRPGAHRRHAGISTMASPESSPTCGHLVDGLCEVNDGIGDVTVDVLCSAARFAGLKIGWAAFARPEGRAIHGLKAVPTDLGLPSAANLPFESGCNHRARSHILGRPRSGPEICRPRLQPGLRGDPTTPQPFTNPFPSDSALPRRRRRTCCRGRGRGGGARGRTSRVGRRGGRGPRS
jgi:hypothetical protein